MSSCPDSRIPEPPLPGGAIPFHHGDTEGTEISQRHRGFSVHPRVLRVSVVNKVPEFFLSFGFTQLLVVMT